jgi:hypothetical protein
MAYGRMPDGRGLLSMPLSWFFSRTSAQFQSRSHRPGRVRQKGMTDNNTDAYRKLVRLVNGVRATQLVRAAVTMNLADAIGDEEPTVENLAARYGIPADRMLRLLRALTAVGVCTEHDAGRYGLTEIGELLRTDRADSAHALVRMFTDEVILGSWPRLLYSVRTGDPAFDTLFDMPFLEYLRDKPDLFALFNAAMGQTTRTVAKRLPDVHDFSRFTRVTDIGGGDGTLLAEVLRRNPGLRGVVYDNAEEVVSQVAETAGAAGVANRCAVVLGDFFQSVPDGADLHLLKNVLHDWDDDRAAVILDHSRAALPEYGRLLIIEPVLPDTVPADADPWPYLSDLNMLVLMNGRERTRGDFERLCKRSGFTVTGVAPVSSDHSVIVAAPA